jgi:pimeloyl-ACP methyl ester carboxylesterase
VARWRCNWRWIILCWFADSVVAAAASWLGEVGRAKLRRYGQLVERGKSGASVLASVLSPRSVQWLAALGLWLSHCLERSADPSDMLATIDAECGYDVTPRLGEITAPTLVIGGARDRAFSPELFTATAAGIRDGPLDPLPAPRPRRHDVRPPLRAGRGGVS